jgi:hypothetical protein
MFENMELELLDIAFQEIAPSYQTIPTGVGFCMGMNRNVINKIGHFDEKTFFRGYGEENDWCRRAVSYGYRNVIVENLFVFHKHGGSFVDAEKKQLIEQNSKKLEERYPDYNQTVSAFCADDPVKIIRDYVVISLLLTIRKVILVFNHNLGGGASYFIEEKINGFLADGYFCIYVRYNINDNNYYLNFIYEKDNLQYTISSIEYLQDILSNVSIETIYINEIVTYQPIFELLHLLFVLNNRQNRN